MPMTDLNLFGSDEPGAGSEPTPEPSPHRGDRPTPEAPLAARMRPRSLDEFRGQEHLLGEGKALRAMLARGEPASMILWGPPGSGKTTLARLIAQETGTRFVPG